MTGLRRAVQVMFKHQRRFQALVVRCIPSAEEEAND